MSRQTHVEVWYTPQVVAQPCTQTIQLSAIRPFSSTGLSVATHCPASDTYRFVEKAECGLCVEPENPDALAEAILTLYHDPDRRERLGRSGRAYVEANG